MSKNTGRKRHRMTLWIVGAAVAVVAVIAAGAFFGLKRFAASGYDYTELSWTEAFDQLHGRMSLHYPFTEWKEIDWDGLNAETRPRIAHAEANGDLEAYYMAMREYAHSIPDGHLQLAGEDFGLREKAIGGGYGLAVIGLDDGRVIAHVVLEDGPAAQAGMVWGAEILSWNGQPIAEAVSQTPTLWAEVTPATEEGHRLEQARYLVRDPVGTEINLVFQNPGAEKVQTAHLIAQDDELEALERTLPPERDAAKTVFRAPIQARVLPSGVGYISITGFMPTLGGLRPAKIVDRTIESFIAKDVPGIIIDVRGNGGGLDALVPQIVGHFFRAPDFYEYIAAYDSVSGEFQIDPSETLTIEPRLPYYDGPVMVLVDQGSVSTAEGIPLTIQRLPQGQVVGICGTHGSFAMGVPGRNLYRLPAGLAITFLEGRSLDAEQTIQVDGNAEGIGGVVPDLRVPLTEETAHALFVEGRDVVLETAIAALEAVK